MKIGVKLVLLSAFLAAFLSYGVSAELIIGQVDSIYNVGDDFDISVTVLSNKDVTDFFTVSLVCGGTGPLEIYRTPLTIEPGEQKEIVLSTKLGKFLVDNKEGTCFIRANFVEEEATSQNFEITRNIGIVLSINGVKFDPSNGVLVKGEAAKSKSDLIDGYFEIRIDGIDYNHVGEIEGGMFEINFTLPDNAKAGKYEIKTRVYEKDSNGEIINEGNESGEIEIRSVIRKVELAFNADSIKPGNEFLYTVLVYDQTEEHFDIEVPIIVYKPDGTEFEQKLVRTDSATPFLIAKNYVPGKWDVKVNIAGLEKRKQFNVEELMEVSFSLENNILNVTNVGNVPFTGPVEVAIGDVREIKQIENLGVGQSIAYRLKAPDGSYAIEVSDGSEKRELGDAVLTGKAISIDEINSAIGGKLNLLLGLIVILILAALGVYAYRKFSKGKKRQMGYEPMKESKMNAPLNYNPGKDLISRGERQESAVIALKVNNPEEMGSPDSPALQALDSALWKIRDSGAKIYSDGDYRVIVLAPILSKGGEISMKALQISQQLERTLNAHNRRFAGSVVKFGIGVNVGDLIVERKDGKFKFMSVDKTISKAKKIAQSSNSEVLISEEMRGRTAGKAKMNRVHDTDMWKLDRVTDHSEHSDYVNRFVDRQKQGK